MKSRFIRFFKRLPLCPPPATSFSYMGFSRSFDYLAFCTVKRLELPFQYSCKELTEIISKEYNFDEKMLYFSDKTAQL